MKTLSALLIPIFPLVVNAAAFTAPHPISGMQHLFRGAQPLGKAEVIRGENIEEVVIFKNDVKGEVAREISELGAEGVAHTHIPMAWKQIDPRVACEQTIEALQILVRAERSGRRTYIHCTAGEDRTGMIAGLARMLLTNATADDVFADELCKHGYADGNPNKPRKVVGDIEAGLTPLFFAIAEKIEGGAFVESRMTDDFCGSLVLDKRAVRRCGGR